MVFKLDFDELDTIELGFSLKFNMTQVPDTAIDILFHNNSRDGFWQQALSIKLHSLVKHHFIIL